MNTRRCQTGACEIAALKRSVSLDMPVATVLANPAREWQKLAYGTVRVAKRVIDVDWHRFNPSDYLMAHCSIVCSVNLDDDGHSIAPCCSALVNNNGNSWSNEVLLATFRSFIGAENYVEHVQIPELSKGKILDAVLRPVVHENDLGKAKIWWCDILVATNRKHADLIRRIESGELSTLSMGCSANYVTCSKCGVVLSDDDENCTHLDNELLQYYTDKQGNRRIVSELCGRMTRDRDGKWVGDPKSVQFIEASWVERPAFVGAVVNHYVSEVPKMSAMSFNHARLADVVDDLFKLRVADVHGMTALRIARAAVLSQKREAMVDRIAQGASLAR